jgi:hypothetical protein
MKTKTCLLIFFSFLILLSCSAISLFSGIYIGRSDQEDETSIVTKDTVTEQPVYYASTSSERYIDKDSDLETFNSLLSDSQLHFTFEFNVQDEQQFEEDRQFILVNLENQYSRLSVKFNKTITNKITIKLVDDIEVFSSDLGTDTLDISGFSAFSLGGDLVEAYINPVYTEDKYAIAHTLSHELVHIFQYQINNEISKYTVTWSGADWFIEGMAEGFSYPNEDSLIHSDVYKTIPDVSTLNSLVDSYDPDAYTIGYDVAELFFLYLTRTYGEDKMVNLVGCKTSFNTCFNQQIGESPQDVFSQWLGTI